MARSDRLPVEYCPPSTDVLQHFAHDFYRAWGEERPRWEDVHAFAGFLSAVSRALAKELTRKSNGAFDTRVE